MRNFAKQRCLYYNAAISELNLKFGNPNFILSKYVQIGFDLLYLQNKIHLLREEIKGVLYQSSSRRPIHENIYKDAKKGVTLTPFFLHLNTIYHSNLNILRFALSIISVFSDAKYICVVRSDSCPIPSLITDSGIPSSRAILAHECRAQYIVSD